MLVQFWELSKSLLLINHELYSRSCNFLYKFSSSSFVIRITLFLPWSSLLTKNLNIQILQSFGCFCACFRQISQIYHQGTQLLKKMVSWLTHWLPDLFSKNAFLDILQNFRLDMGQIAPIYSKRHLQHDSKPFFPLASHFMTFLLGCVQDEKVTYDFTFFVSF